MNKPTICLNMIVKNEEHVIIETLENLCSYIDFSYWVISDTGSTDNTKNVISNFFIEKNIPGELVEHKWKDFGYNRTKALECAYNKTDYLFIFDADDKINGDFKLPQVCNLDQYQIKIGQGFVYTRPLFVTNRKKWRFKGVLHETLSAVDEMIGIELLEGDYYIESGRTGNRSKNPNKYLDDANVLKNAFDAEYKSDYGLACRYAFYCAQSYNDAGSLYKNESIKWYKKVLDLGNWDQEKYYSCYMIGTIYKELNDNENAVKYWLKTVEYDSERIEGIVDAVEYYRTANYNILVNALYHKFKNYSKDLNDKLFVNQYKYCDELEYNNSISAYYVNDHRSGYDCCKQIILNKLLSSSLLQLTLSNILFYKDILETESAESCLDLFYAVDNLIYDAYNINSTYCAGAFELWELLFAKTRSLLTMDSNKTFTNNSSPQVFISFTTCKRVDLFNETMNSILNHWTDVDKIDYWFCVDDNSTDDDREQMKRKYNWIDYYMKTQEEKGHRQSMNIIWNKLSELKPKYWIHMEDDFLFHKKMDYVSEAIRGFNNGEPENVKQILFNRNYGETIEDYRIKGHVVVDNVDLVIHDYKIGNFTYGNCHYWPHYSFRPSMTDVETILKLGNFDSENQFFEMDYANKWSSNGYKSGFFNRITNRHIGRLTSERNNKKVKNAYELNEEEQFQNQTSSTDDSNVYLINLDRRKDRLNYIEQNLKIPYERFAAIDGNYLYSYTDFSDLLTTIDNTYVVLGEIGCKLSHYALWSKIKHDTLIVEDDIMFTKNSISSFKNAYDNLKNINIEWDIIYVGGQWTPDYGIHSSCYMDVHKITESNLESMFIHIYDNFYLRKNSNNDTFNSPLYRTTAAYIISERGAKKLMTIIQKNTKEFMEQPADMWLLQLEKDNKIVMLDYLSHPFYQGGFDLVKDECLLKNDINRGDRTLINIQSNMNNVEEQFVFLNGLDQYGCDIYCNPNNELLNLLQLALNDKKCIAVNSLGFYKNKIQNLTTSNYFRSNDGIYIKKEHYDTSRTHLMCLDLTKYDYTYKWVYTSEIRFNLLKYVDPKVENKILEIGSFEGLSASCFSDNLLDNQKSFLICVDPFSDTDVTTNVSNETELRFKSNISKSKNSNKCIHHKCYSNQFFNTNQTTFNVIYIDGSHLPEDITYDMEESFAILENNGIMWMDDYMGGGDDEGIIKKTMDLFLEKYKKQCVVIHTGYQLGIQKKCSGNKTRVKMMGNFWDSNKELIDEFNLMIPSKNYIYNDIEITATDDNIDYYVIINQPPNEEIYYDPARTLIFQMEPEAKNSNYGTHTWGDWYKPDKNRFKYVNDLTEHLNVVQWRLNIPYDTLSNAIENKMNNKIASIVSYKNYFDGHTKRIEFIKYIENHNLIDVFGKDNYHNFNCYNGPLPDNEPSNVLIPYKYYFMPENNAEHNYATEKIWEPILCECLCFYWGCPNLEDFIDSRAFVRLPLDNFEESLAIVKKAIEEDWWSHRIEFIRQAKYKILNELAFFPNLAKLIT